MYEINVAYCLSVDYAYPCRSCSWHASPLGVAIVLSHSLLFSLFMGEYWPNYFRSLKRGRVTA